MSFNLANVPKSGKAVEVDIFAYNQTYVANQVITAVKIENATPLKGYGGFIVNSKLFRIADPANAEPLDLVLYLYEEKEVLDLSHGDNFESKGLFSAGHQYPFSVIEFDIANEIKGAEHGADPVYTTNTIKATEPILDTFQCLSGRNEIYAVLVNRTEKTLAAIDKYVLQISFGY